MDSTEISKLFQAIEDADFAAQVNLAQGYKHFLRILAADPLICQLPRLFDDRENAERCLQRIWDISQISIDERFEHPYDAALSGYLFALESGHRDLAKIACGAIQRCQNCWWAKHMARELISAEPESVQGTTTLTRSTWPAIPVSVPDEAYRDVPTTPGLSPTEEQILQSMNWLSLDPVRIFHTSEPAIPRAENEAYVFGQDEFVEFEGTRSLAITQAQTA